MRYFFYFQKKDYKLSDRTVRGITNLSQFINFNYDQKDNISFYTYYELQRNERLDQISFKLYNDIQYYWTIPLLNPDIKNIWKDMSIEYNSLENRLKNIYPNISFLVDKEEDIVDKFTIDEFVDVKVNGTTREFNRPIKISKIFSTRGYLEIEGIDDDEFYILKNLDNITIHGQSSNDEVKISGIIESFRSPLYYILKEGAEIISYTTYKSINSIPYTILEDEIRKNEKKSKIKVIRKEFIRDISREFIEKMKG
jgi:hypothetical protein